MSTVVCPDQPLWRAMKVKSRHEKLVAQSLRGRGLEEFLPLHVSKRQWSDRSKVVEMPLFPGYVFCRVPYTHRLLAVSTPGVTSIVGFAGEDAAVPEEEIQSIRQMLASGLPLQPCSYARTGHIVEIQVGPLAGLRGEVIREKGLWRLVVNVALLQRSVAAELGREMVEVVGNRPEVLAGAVA